jgi:predicted phage terminase large subunit-like protein
MLNCAKADGPQTIVAFMQDPGSAGVAEAQATARALDGFNVKFAPASGDKETRAKPISAQAEAGNVKIVLGLWNDEFIRILENFPDGKKDDEVDGLSGAHGVLSDNSSRGFDEAAWRGTSFGGQVIPLVTLRPFQPRMLPQQNLTRGLSAAAAEQEQKRRGIW